MTDPADTPPSADNEFTRESVRRTPGLVRELWDWLKHNRKWWLAPLLIALLVVGILVVLGSTVLGPFIYPLF